MMIEILTIEGGRKRCLLTRGDQIYKKTLLLHKNNHPTENQQK